MATIRTKDNRSGQKLSDPDNTLLGNELQARLRESLTRYKSLANAAKDFGVCESTLRKIRNNPQHACKYQYQINAFVARSGAEDALPFQVLAARPAAVPQAREVVLDAEESEEVVFNEGPDVVVPAGILGESMPLTGVYSFLPMEHSAKHKDSIASHFKMKKKSSGSACRGESARVSAELMTALSCSSDVACFTEVTIATGRALTWKLANTTKMLIGAIKPVGGGGYDCLVLIIDMRRFEYLLTRKYCVSFVRGAKQRKEFKANRVLVYDRSKKVYSVFAVAHAARGYQDYMSQYISTFLRRTIRWVRESGVSEFNILMMADFNSSADFLPLTIEVDCVAYPITLLHNHFVRTTESGSMTDNILSLHVGAPANAPRFLLPRYLEPTDFGLPVGFERPGTHLGFRFQMSHA